MSPLPTRAKTLSKAPTLSAHRTARAVPSHGTQPCHRMQNHPTNCLVPMGRLLPVLKPDLPGRRREGEDRTDAGKHRSSSSLRPQCGDTETPRAQPAPSSPTLGGCSPNVPEVGDTPVWWWSRCSSPARVTCKGKRGVRCTTHLFSRDGAHVMGGVRCTHLADGELLPAGGEIA